MASVSKRPRSVKSAGEDGRRRPWFHRPPLSTIHRGKTRTERGPHVSSLWDGGDRAHAMRPDEVRSTTIHRGIPRREFVGGRLRSFAPASLRMTLRETCIHHRTMLSSTPPPPPESSPSSRRRRSMRRRSPCSTPPDRLRTALVGGARWRRA